MNLAKNLKYLRLKHGLSQEYLAKKFGYKSYTTIQKWETGTSEPSLETLYELSKMYDVSMQSMYTLDLELGQKTNSIIDMSHTKQTFFTKFPQKTAFENALQATQIKGLRCLHARKKRLLCLLE